MRLTSRRSQPPLALSVPLSRFTSRVGGGSAFYVRQHFNPHQMLCVVSITKINRQSAFVSHAAKVCVKNALLTLVRVWRVVATAKRACVQSSKRLVSMTKTWNSTANNQSRLRSNLWRIKLLLSSSRKTKQSGGKQCRIMKTGSNLENHQMLPNKSPEPTAVGRFSSAFAVHVASRRWLSFLR